MSELFEKSIRTLELPAVLEKLAAKAVSQAAKDRCLKLTPSTDAEEVLRLLDETDAAKERLGLHGSPSFSGVKDVSAALTRADHGGMLNTRELLDIAGVLTASRRVSDYDAQRQGEETVLDRLFTSLHTNKYLEEQIRSAILDEETIADTASSELADIRRKMRLAASKGRQPVLPIKPVLDLFLCCMILKCCCRCSGTLGVYKCKCCIKPYPIHYIHCL